MAQRPINPDALKGAVVGCRRTARGMTFSIRLTNTAERTLHYIADVRGLKYDPATKRLLVRLSDEGRVVVLGIAYLLPEVRAIDLKSEAELEVRVPETIIQLAEPSGGEQVSFEKHRLTEAEEVVIEIAWADTPFYQQDPWPSTEEQLPAARWQQHKVTISTRPPCP